MSVESQSKNHCRGEVVFVKRLRCTTYVVHVALFLPSMRMDMTTGMMDLDMLVVRMI
jgi:hypothetical protein